MQKPAHEQGHNIQRLCYALAHARASATTLIAGLFDGLGQGLDQLTFFFVPIALDA